MISSPAYAYRMNRLKELDEKTSELCGRLYNAEVKTGHSFFSAEIDKAYKQIVFDVQKGTGVSAAFDIIPQSRIDKILNTEWSGEHFSKRVWGNTQTLADGLKNDMLVGIMSGKSEQRMAEDIMNRCAVGAFEARRLVRTETTYISNQAELEGYKELDIEKYEFSACLDNRTSEICNDLDGKVFDVKDAVPGKNLPPMHPFCRSTTLPVLPSEEDLDRELAELGDEIGADVDFDEWVKGLQKTEDGRVVYRAASVDKSGESGIIKLSSKFVNPNEKLYRYADSIKPIDGFCDIVCHGSPKELIINGFNDEEWTYSAKQAAEMIRNSSEFNGKKIRLISCQTGAGDNCIAQQIADELGVEVMAPTEIVNVNSDGEMFLSDNKFIADMWNNGEAVSETGKWLVFKPKGGS